MKLRPNKAVIAALVAPAFALLLAAGAAPGTRASVAGRLSTPAAPKLLAGTTVKQLPAGSIDVGAVVSGFSVSAEGLAVDSSGNMYVSFRNTSSKVEVAVLSPDARLLRRWDPTGGKSVGDPTKLAVGPDGLVYVRNRNETLVRVFRTDGTPVRSFGTNTLSPNAFGDIEVDGGGNVYVISGDHVVRFSAAGAVTGNFQPVAGLQSSDRLTGLGVAPDGSMYVGVDVRSNPTPADKLPLLAHIDASGNRLPDPAPLLHRLVGVGEHYGYVPADVDFANDRIYIAGSPAGLAVLTPAGALVDVIGKSDRGQHQVAVLGRDTYTTGVTATRATFTVAQGGGVLGHWHGQDVSAPGGFGSGVSGCGLAGHIPPGEVGDAIFPETPSGCYLHVLNQGNPCPAGSIATPLHVYLNGREIPREALVGYEYRRKYDVLRFDIPSAQIADGGDLLVEWSCVDKQTNAITSRWEWKLRISILKDPSGTVLDARSGRPVAGAVVRLQFSVRKQGPFGVPGATGYAPQRNPQTTGKSGFFGWDVADGFWRLKVTAFGYKPLTSPVYKVPPEVTGLRLKLRPNPAQQRFVVDPQTGRAGPVRLGTRLRSRRVAGLKIVRVRGRITSIVVRSKRYRTVEGVRVGARASELVLTYPPRASATTAGLLTSKKAVRYRFAKATFTVRRGRVIGIKLGR